MLIDPRHLVQLSMIIETGSFHAAAEKLGLSQPALSRNIKMLEQRIRAPVFDRSARNAVPTNLGLKLAQNGLTTSSGFCGAYAAFLKTKKAPPILTYHF